MTLHNQTYTYNSTFVLVPRFLLEGLAEGGGGGVGREDVTFDFWHMAYTWQVELQTG